MSLLLLLIIKECENIYIYIFHLCSQVKKIARRQNQDGGKNKKDGDSNNDKTKLKLSTEKKDDDSESDTSFIGNTDQNGNV